MIHFTREAWEQYLYWQTTVRNTLKWSRWKKEAKTWPRPEELSLARSPVFHGIARAHLLKPATVDRPAEVAEKDSKYLPSES
jgi:hypothetical protein